MNDLLRRTPVAALIAGGVLLVAACGDGAEEATANDVAANVMFEEPANDQSALESTANITEVAPVANEGATDENAVEESDNGMVESNVAGM